MPTGRAERFLTADLWDDSAGLLRKDGARCFLADGIRSMETIIARDYRALATDT